MNDQPTLQRASPDPSFGHEQPERGVAPFLEEETSFGNRGEPGDCSVLKGNGDGYMRLSSMPEINRVSMVPSPIDRYPIRRLWRKIWKSDKSLEAGKRDAQPRLATIQKDRVENGWHRAAWRRRSALAALVLAQTGVASWSLVRTFPYPSLSGLEFAIVTTFVILFSWISFSFWIAITGFWALWRKTNRFSLRHECAKAGDQPLRSRTAVLVPICNEEVDRVFACVEASYRSLVATRQLEHFDFYVLSDTSEPERQVEEEIAWSRLCEATAGFGRVFYRHRRNNIKRKSGNIADFLRRWGQNYDYMIVFDADSIMAGEALVNLARLMDGHPQAGIIQTAPTIVNRESLFARAQQFASHVYGAMFSASLHFWQLGESYYWGHNAILRVKPFLRHCGLSRLPDEPPLGGEILSHDFVEAALMGRAGWEVWLVYDLPGSYEESPPTILDELKRDRRWCQGNLQHLRLLLSDGFRFGHRAIMVMGIMAYASSFFWAIFLVLMTVEIAVESLVPPVYFSSTPSLFPLWPRWHPELAIALLTTTAVLLFLPKFLSYLLILKNRHAASYGGPLRLLISILLEIAVSTLLAPLRMWYHSKFVLLTLLGREIKWGSQRRDEKETGWVEALRQHGFSMAFGLLWIGGLFWLNSLLAWWALPVAIPLVCAAPISAYSSRVSFGRALRRWRLFLVPEERVSPEVLQRLCKGLQQSGREQPRQGGFLRVANDSDANAVHVALLRGKRPRSPKARERNRKLLHKALAEGPGSLSRAERSRLLRDADSIVSLHLNVRRIRNSRLINECGSTAPQ
jgi:membrane glycosyltransferase